MEANAYRLTPHSSDDDDRSYRSRDEVAEFKKRDPLLVTRKILEDEGLLDEARYASLEEKAKKMIDSAVQYAESAPFPAPEEGAYPVYFEEIKHG